MLEDARRGRPTWIVVLTAIVGPFVMAILFLAALDSVHMSDDQRRADPDSGYTQAYLDEGVVALYGLAQVAFLIAAPLLMTRRPGLRITFVAIALPLCLVVFLLTVVSQIAR